MCLFIGGFLIVLKGVTSIFCLLPEQHKSLMTLILAAVTFAHEPCESLNYKLL